MCASRSHPLNASDLFKYLLPHRFPGMLVHGRGESRGGDMCVPKRICAAREHRPARVPDDCHRAAIPARAASSGLADLYVYHPYCDTFPSSTDAYGGLDVLVLSSDAPQDAVCLDRDKSQRAEDTL